MNDTMGYRHIPHIFFIFITFLVATLPIRSVPTFIELMIGAMLTQAGFVTQAWLAISMHRHWTSYYKWLQKGKWSWVALGLQMAKLLIKFFPNQQGFLVMDDTIIFRSSKKAPGSKINHQHGTKANRPQYVRGQNWLSMAAVISHGLSAAAIPLLSAMMTADGNTSKLDMAKILIRTIFPVFDDKYVCLLLDSWFMRKKLILYALSKGFHVIGQVRKDTALYDIPERTGKKGRPRKYGDKYTPARIAYLSQKRERLFVYGKWQWVRYKSVVAKARFLNGGQVRVVWVCLEDNKGDPLNERLILATDIFVSPCKIITAYARRWTIETMFSQIKNNWGWKEAWQQTSLVLHRWTQVLSIGYAIPQLLALKGEKQIAMLPGLTPWRVKRRITAGQVRLWLQRILCHVKVRDWWNPKCRKFELPNLANAQYPIMNLRKNRHHYVKEQFLTHENTKKIKYNNVSDSNL